MTAREVDFESINVAADPVGLEALQSLGFRRVPVVAKGDNAVHGVDLTQVALLLGDAYDTQPVLQPRALIERYILVLRAFERFAAQVPRAALLDKLPNRDRTYLSLMNHLVEVAAGFVAIARGADFTDAVSRAVPEVDLNVEPLVERSAGITRDLAVLTVDYGRIVHTYFGPQSLHAVLERCTWHTTQHVRQLMMVLGTLGVAPDGPLTDADLADLPLPAQVWDS